MSEHVLAVDFGGSKVALAAVTEAGVPLVEHRFTFAPGTHARDVLDEAVRELAALRRHPALAGAGPCRGIGVTSPGVVTDDRIHLAPNVPGWGGLALAEELRAATGVPEVVVANDVKAATWAEHRWGALAGSDPGLYVNLGTGIAAGIVVGGEVLGGAHGAAGEIGYLPVHLAGLPAGDGCAAGRPSDLRPAGPADPDGPVLEDLVGGGAIGRRARTLPDPVGTARELFARAATDPAAAAIVRDVVRTIGGAVAAVATMLDPQRIALGGGLMAAADLLVPGVRDVVDRLAPMPVEIVPARFVHQAALRGAAALVTHRR